MQKRSCSPISTLAFALCLGISRPASAADIPEVLATDLQSALGKGDIDAALALGDFNNTVPYQKWFYLRSVVECAHESICSVSVQADDPTAAAERNEQQLKLGLEYAVEPAGVLVLTSVSRKPGEGTKPLPRRDDVRIPYAKISGQYRILTARYSPKKLAELRAQSNEKLLDAMFERGINLNDPQKILRADWKTVAIVLPAGGGEIGAAYADKVAHDYVRYSTGDLAAVLALGDESERRQFDGSGFLGKPVAKSIRLLQLRAESVRMLVNVKVLGGYQLGDDVVLDTQGVAENGWIDRGPVLLKLNSSGEIERSFSMTVSYPK